MHPFGPPCGNPFRANLVREATSAVQMNRIFWFRKDGSTGQKEMKKIRYTEEEMFG